MKKTYLKPEIEMVKLYTEDILTSSDPILSPVDSISVNGGTVQVSKSLDNFVFPTDFN